ncbi:S9 family peptidase [Aeromicrobium sp. 9AM]|uniref:alpha/beta hydrolase family protein n=1 Tax=Aeromicrobium sp. 9AM TaxID=2653126 RepID=UPI0012F2EB15|nr:lipase [Aeromicrobium sp. 9AM]VXB84276.1 conserved exported hypothetical protein [Aeromicrobium sp. 9AM]
MPSHTARHSRTQRRVTAGILTAVAATAALAGCGSDPSETSGPQTKSDEFRGTIVSSTKVADLSAAKATAYLDDAGFDAGHVTYGVTAYRIVYRTVGLDAKETRASGLVVVPKTDRRELQAVSYTHGTTTFKRDVASEWSDDYNTSPGVMYASAGFVAVLPDYLGLGRGPGVHPWMHVATETSASLDMLRASRTFVAERQHRLAKDVLITGFSQGASSALGLAHALQDGADPDFAVGAIAPISGGYDFAGVELPALVRGELDPKASVVYTGLMLTSWDRTFDLFDDPQDVFMRPYATKMAKVFDGTTPGETMMKTLPGGIAELLTDDGRKLLEHPSGRLLTALKQADAVCHWSPTAPTRLYVAQDDEQAASANTPSCHSSLAGSDVVDLGTPEHFGSRHIGSNVAGSARALGWFLELSDAA